MIKLAKKANEYVSQIYDVFKPWLVEGAEFSGKYELPKICGVPIIPKRAIPFDKALKASDKKQWVHFYIDDYRFERIWHNPKAYLSCLKQFEGVISPDFSLYRDMPLSMQVWNTYRNRAIAYWLQCNGVNVIPNIRWGDGRTHEFCFDGIASNNTVATSTSGCLQSKVDRQYFKNGFVAMIEKLKPKTIVNYSRTPDDIFSVCTDKGIEVVNIPNWNDTIRGKVST